MTCNKNLRTKGWKPTMYSLCRYNFCFVGEMRIVVNKKAMRIFILAVAIAVIAVSFISFTGCAGVDRSDDDTILIGVLGPFSGSEAAYGDDMYRSYQLACDEINAGGGILGRKLQLFKADDACDQTTAVQAASKIIAKDVDFVVGGYASGVTIPTLSMFKEENLLMLVSAANSTRITEQGCEQTFMINSPGSHAAVTLSDLCVSLGSKKVVLIHQQEDYSQNLADLCKAELPKHNIAVVGEEVMPRGTPDVSDIATSIKNSGADFVYWCGYHDDGSKIIRKLREIGYTGNIAVGDGSADFALIEFCGTAGEGIYVTSPPFVEFAEGGEKFINDYKAKFNTDPGTYATLSYDTIYLLKAAVEKANSLETAKVCDALKDIEHKGLSGLITFNSNRELAVSNFIVLQIENGKFQLVDID